MLSNKAIFFVVAGLCLLLAIAGVVIFAVVKAGLGFSLLFATLVAAFLLCRREAVAEVLRLARLTAKRKGESLSGRGETATAKEKKNDNTRNGVSA